MVQCAHIQMLTCQTIQTVLVVRDKIVIQAKRESCYKEYCTHNLGEREKNRNNSQFRKITKRESCYKKRCTNNFEKVGEKE